MKVPLEVRELPRRDDAGTEEIWRGAAEPLRRSAGSETPLPAEVRRLVAVRGGVPLARGAFGARTGFAGAPGLTGYVGWFAASEAAAGVEVLREAAERLLASGAARVVGPLDGSTWYRYRLALPREGSIDDGEAFLSEPQNPPEWIEQFESAGFRPLLEYETRRVAEPAANPQLAGKRADLVRRGVRIRPLSAAGYHADLHRLYELSVVAFAKNPLYTPIAVAEFERLYAPLRSLLDPELVLLAEDESGRLLGYVFSFPDALSPDIPRIVLKTLAVHPDARGLGLGAILVDEVHAAAAARGASVLHALMQVTNASTDISRRSESELFRRYVLYARGPA